MLQRTASAVLVSVMSMGLGAACGSSKSETGTTSSAFECVGSVRLADPRVTEATVTATMRSYAGLGAAAGVKATLCAKDDATCANPLGTTTSGEDGRLTLTVATGLVGFDGYVKSELPGYITKLHFANPPIIASTDAVSSVMIPDAAWSMFLAAVGVTAEPSHGHAALIATDCTGNTAEGITFAIDRADEKTALVYVDANGIPRSGATATDASGRAIFLNTPAGAISVVGTIVSSNKRLGTVRALVQPGAISGIQFPPTP